MTDNRRSRGGWTWLACGLGLAGVALMVAILTPLLVTDRWWGQSLNFPQVQFAVLLAVLALAVAFLLDLGKTLPRLLLAGLIACGVYQATFLLRYTPLAATELRGAAACPARDRLRVLTLNVLRNSSGEIAPAVLDLVRSADPDLFLALETDPAWARALQPLKANYRHVVDASRANYWGMMLFSRLPLADPEVRYLVDGYVPSIRARVLLPSGAAPVFHGLHPKPPLPGNVVRKGDTEIVAAGREIVQGGGAAVLAGDLNDVPWSSTIQLFQRVGGMRDPRVGRGLYPTYETGRPLLSWPIDHVFASPAFSVIDYRTLPDVGSDHYPVLATLCHDPPAGRAIKAARE